MTSDCLLHQVLSRLLGGLDGPKMVGVAEAFERKYSQPLWSALRAALSPRSEYDAGTISTTNNLLSAALFWLRSFHDPSSGAERFTEVDVATHTGDAPAMASMLDYLFLEHESLLVCDSDALKLSLPE